MMCHHILITDIKKLMTVGEENLPFDLETKGQALTSKSVVDGPVYKERGLP